jgi:anti-anti-sigma regulatory factor
MELTKLAEDIAYIELPPEPRVRKVLGSLNDHVSGECNFDLIIDFSFVEVLTSVSVSNLISLQNWIKGAGHRLVFCSVAVVTKCIFDVAGLDTFFVFAENKDSALALLTQNKQTSR